MKLSELARDFDRYLKDQGYSRNTIDCYSTATHQFLAYLTGQVRKTDDLRNFTPEYCQGFSNEMARLGAQASTRVRRLSGLDTFARYLMKVSDGKKGYLLTDNPLKRFDWPVEQRPETTFLRAPELRAFFQVALAPEDALIRAVLSETGARCSEVCEASVEDLQDLGGEYYLRSIVKGRRTRARKQSVPLTKALWDQIWTVLREAGRKAPTDPVFVDRNGRRLTRTQLGSMVARWGKRAGITRCRVHPHMFRHTVGVMLKVAGVDKRTTSLLLRQSDSRSADRYDHVADGELSAAREKQMALLRQFLGEAPAHHAAPHVSEPGA